MKREEIMNRIGELIKAEIGAEYEVQFREVKKNNNLILQAIEIRKFGDNVSPVIYIDKLLDAIENGNIKPQEAVREILNSYESTDTKRISEVSKMFNKKEILERVVYQIIGTERNKSRLVNLPHKELLDLSVIYRVIIDTDCESTESFLVSNGICNKYSISEKELDAAARFNTEKKGFQTMQIAPGMFAISNRNYTYGAAVMLYKSYFDAVAHMLKSDLYILPSSIHDVIVVPAEQDKLENFKLIVSEVNATPNCVAEHDVLSENVYKYSLETGSFSIADGREE